MSYFQRHVFFCCNQREAGENCCNRHGAEKLRAYAKDKVKALKLNGEGKVRINSAGCLDRCKSRVKAERLAGPGGVRVNRAGCLDRCAGGPVAVVYPEAVWYTYVDTDDIDEIISEHLQNGRIVERLRI